MSRKRQVRSHSAKLLLCGWSILGAAAALAQESPLVIPRASEPPKLEDYLSGEPQEAGVRIDDFRQLKPGDGQPSSHPIRAYLSYDDKNIYAIFVCEDSPKDVRARMSRREDIDNDDVVGIFFDTFHDRQRSYVFVVNPLGIQQDLIRTEGQKDDVSFDTLWHSQGRLTGNGYVVRMAIPFKSLRFANQDRQTWGIALARGIIRLNEESYWPYITERKESFVQQMGDAVLAERISPGRNIQLIPYGAFSDARFLNPDAPGGPAFETDREFRGGIDAKAVIKDALTVDLTLNPDFSQVEADEPQVTVNQRFEVFFPEKRPFFIENAGYFETPLNLFFSRRVSHPRLGARLTGKVGALAIGTLVMDDRSPGESLPSDDPQHGKAASNGVLRLQYEFGRQTTAGFFGSRRGFGSGHNELASADTRVRLTDNWMFTGQAVASRTRELDGSREDGSAYMATLYYRGRSLVYGMEYSDISPDFQADLGFIPRVDIRKLDHRLIYYWRPEGRSVVSFGPGSHYLVNWDHEGRLQDWMIDNWFNVEMTGQTRIQGWWGESYVLHRGLGFRERSPGFVASTERFKWILLSALFEHGNHVNYFPAEGLDPFLGKRTAGRASVTVLPTPALRLEQTYFYTHMSVLNDDPEQGLSKGTSIFNNHIFRTKLNYQFTRPLSLRFIFDYESVLPNSELVDLEKTKRPVFDVLLTYLLNPGTALYAGYTERWENLEIVNSAPPTLSRIPDPSTRTSRQFFVKFSYLFRF